MTRRSSWGTSVAHNAAPSFLFNPELPVYNDLNTRIGVVDGRWDIAFFLDNATDEQAFLAFHQEGARRPGSAI